MFKTSLIFKKRRPFVDIVHDIMVSRVSREDFIILTSYSCIGRFVDLIGASNIWAPTSKIKPAPASTQNLGPYMLSVGNGRDVCFLVSPQVCNILF